MKLMFLGDVHGSGDWLDLACEIARENDVDWVVQVGDFGYWEHRQNGREFLDSASKSAEKYDLQIVFVDGNHENHTMLRLNYGPGGNLHELTPDGFWKVRDRVYYAPRGHRWTWEGVTFLALGGAYSVDKEWRIAEMRKKAKYTQNVGKYALWWPEELITDEEVETAIAGGLVDIMVCHDAPASVTNAIPPNGTWDRNKDAFPDSLMNRHRLQRVVNETKPFLLVHGHYHYRNHEIIGVPGEEGGELSYHPVQIEGLERDGDVSSMWALELDKAHRRAK